MKLLRFMICVLMTTMIFYSSLNAEINPALKDLCRNKKYFDLRDTLKYFEKDKSEEMAYFRGTVAGKFNKPDEAIKHLNTFLASKAAGTDSETAVDAYEMLADSYVKAGIYKKAAETLKDLLEKYPSSLDSSKTAEITNSIRLWKSFSDVKPQKVTFNGETRFKMSRDKANLTNIPVGLKSGTIDFIFDTGAGISSITESSAEKLGIKLVGDSIEVGAVTGNKVMASLGAAPPFTIGGITVENAIFLIFKDSDLAVKQIDFQINGIIGFPVIKDLGDITITKEDSIIIKEETGANSLGNMFLEELTPVVAGEYNGKRLSFSFDTGARSTLLYFPFYRDYESDVKRLGTEKTHEVAGAGGSRKLEGYNLNEISLKIAEKNIQLKDVSVVSSPIGTNSLSLYGNLGQDVISQFERMEINFTTMSLRFH